MNQRENISDLQSIIRKEVAPLITHDYVLWGLPYYPNIGDTLIWEGELEFLKSVPYKCLGTCGWDEYEPIKLSKETVILITGGGYFGDVWRKAWDAVLDTIEHYPDNPIVILPNTIFYEDVAVMQSDAHRMARLKHLTICVRDKVSYEIAKTHFKNEVRLVPDMAFCISQKYLEQWRVNETEKTLFLKRIDKELGKGGEVHLDIPNLDIRDWPTMDGRASISERIFGRCRGLCCRSQKYAVWFYPLARKLEEKCGYYLYRKCMTRRGVEFVSQYKAVYTTRLHVMILSVLLEKPVQFIDNSYGKLSSFYDTWLKNCRGVECYEKK